MEANKDKHYRFFENKECEYYPCHRLERINCLFCFCPLYPFDDCGGHYTRTKRGLKDCSDCALPHGPGGYDAIIERLKREAPADGTGGTSRSNP